MVEARQFRGAQLWCILQMSSSKRNASGIDVSIRFIKIRYSLSLKTRCRFSSWSQLAFRVHEAEPGSLHITVEQTVPSPRVLHRRAVADGVPPTASRHRPLLLPRRTEQRDRDRERPHPSTDGAGRGHRHWNHPQRVRVAARRVDLARCR